MMADGVDTRFMGKEFLTEFIEIYRNHPALWKTKSKDYTNKNLKIRGYEALIEFSKKVYPSADRSFVFKKIQNLRGCFRKELKKLLNSKSTGAGRDDVYEPRLWYFELLLFTSDQEIPVESTESQNFEESIGSISEDEKLEENGARNEENGTGNEQEAYEERNDNTDTSSQAAFRKPTTPKRKEIIQKTSHTTKRSRQSQSFQEKHEKFMEACVETLKQKNDITDEFDAIGFNVAAKLRKMSTCQQIIAEALISKILTKGLFEELSRTTNITVFYPTNNTVSVTLPPSPSATSQPIPLQSSHSNLSFTSTNITPEQSPSSDMSTYYYNTAQEVSSDLVHL